MNHHEPQSEDAPVELLTLFEWAGGCPECGRNDGSLFIRSQEWCRCDIHRVKWFVSAGCLDTSHLTEEDWQRAAEFLDGYAEVDDILEADFGGRTTSPSRVGAQLKVANALGLEAIRRQVRGPDQGGENFYTVVFTLTGPGGEVGTDERSTAKLKTRMDARGWRKDEALYVAVCGAWDAAHAVVRALAESEPADRRRRLSQAVRNVLVHNAGTSDGDFRRQVKGDPRFSTMQEGETVELTGPLTVALVESARTQGYALMRFVDNWYNVHIATVQTPSR